MKLSDIETHKVFYDKLTFIYLEMPKFDKSIDELKTRFDKWLYVLKNLSRLQDIPEKLQDRVFKKLFKAAEIAKFTPEEAMQYEDSLKVYRDLKNTLDTAREEGEIKGKRETARKMLAKGMNIDLISELTGFSKDDIELLQPLDDDFRTSEDPATYRKRKPIKRKRAKRTQA